MFRRSLVWAIPAVLVMGATSAMAADPTIEQVRSAASAGDVNQALTMMDQVLKDHPSSAKAHYVEAELMARQHQYGGARQQLAKAEELAPDLPFVSKHSINELRQQLSGSQSVGNAVQPVAPSASGFSLWPIVLIAALILGVFALLRRRRSAYQPGNLAPMSSGGYNGPAYGAQPGPWGAQPSGGVGSGIMGGLATGAAMGAGFAASEAVIDHFTHDDREREREPGAYPTENAGDANNNQDMGGDDFGISDSGSWDDSGSGGGGGSDGW